MLTSDTETIKNQIKENVATLINQQKIEEAKLLLAQYMHLVKADSDTYCIQAVIAMQEGNLNAAEDILYDALFQDNNNFDLWYNLGYLYELWNLNTKAQAIYTNLLKTNLDDANNVIVRDALKRLEVILPANNNTTSDLKKVKILQGTMEIANQMHTLTNTLQKKAYNIHSINYYPSYLGYQGDLDLKLDTCKTEQELYQRIQSFAKQSIKEYDLFHFHFGTTLAFDHADLPILKKLNKHIIMQYWGSEIRRYSVAKQYNPYVKVKAHDEEQMLEDLNFVAKYVEHCIVADWELYLYVKDFFRHVHFLPTAIDLTKYQPIKKNKKNNKLLIVHAPTHQEIKGTKYIVDAIEKLKIHYQFEFQLVQGLSHKEAKKIYQQADIIVDQIRAGSYGILALESMAMGKPVISWISDYMKEKYPQELPIISANPDTIKSVLESILNNTDLLTNIGEKGRAYVNKYHNVLMVTEQLARIYQKVIHQN